MSIGETDPEQLTAEQRKLMRRAEAEHKKLLALNIRVDAQRKLRDDAVRAALDGGIGQTLIAKTLTLTKAMIWKIGENATTKQLAERQSRKGRR